VAMTCVTMVAAVALLVAALGPMRGRGSATPSVIPESGTVAPPSRTNLTAPTGYVQPTGWPAVRFATGQAGVEAVLDMTNPTMRDPVVFAGGTVDGFGWGLVSYQPTASDPDLGGTCASAMVDPIADPRSGVGLSQWCTDGFVASGTDDLMDVGTNFEATTEATFETVHVVVSHRVVAVRARMRDGTVAVFPTITGPPGSPFDLAVFFPPLGLAGRIEALAAGGSVLDASSICVTADLVEEMIAEGQDAWSGCTA
jgi:hypothetical protein